MIYQAKVYYSLFGRNVNNRHSCVFKYRSSNAPGNASFEALHVALAASLSTILIPQCQILRVVSSKVREPGGARIPRNQQMATVVHEAGKRPNTANKNVGLVEHVAVFGKSASIGNAGLTYVRGCFLDGEINSGTGGTPEIVNTVVQTPFTAFATALPTIFADHGGTLVLPAPEGASFDSGARPVTRCDFQGVGVLQSGARRISLDQAKKELAKRELSDLEKQLYEAGHDAAGQVIAIAQAVLNGLLQILLALIGKYTITYLNRIGMPTLVRTLLLPLVV